jgi:hypothetical protein
MIPSKIDPVLVTQAADQPGRPGRRSPATRNGAFLGIATGRAALRIAAAVALVIACQRSWLINVRTDGRR